MLAKITLLMGVGLLSISLGAAAQQNLVLTPGSAAAFVLKPARAVTAGAATTTTTTTTTTADQCGINQASAAIGSCCFSSNTDHKTFGRAILFYQALGSTTSLGIVGANNNYLRKTNPDFWDKVASCS